MSLMSNNSPLGLRVGAFLVLLLGGCGDELTPTPAAREDASFDGSSPQDSGTADADSPRQDAAHRTDAAQPAPDSGEDSGVDMDIDSGAAATGPNVDRSNPALHDLELDPLVLDPDASDSLAKQYAELDTRATPLGKLVVFLPGANNTPADWREHGRVLASFGFHVLIPHYNNRWSSDGTCDGMGSSCYDDTRWEALVGEDTSSAVDIARGDSAEGRVVTLIKYLMTAEPGGDWGYYLGANDALAYGDMIIAGISHGAASAGMYAARRPFSRNVMHSSGPAGSAGDAKLTPLAAWYGFAHTEDPAYDPITASWEAFGLLGSPTSIDGRTAPYADSHRLITSEPSGYPHGSTCAHSSSPKDGLGNYVFDPAWRYLYGAPAP